MNEAVSILRLTSAMARHAGHVHAATARNIARADIPGATAERAAAFEKSVRALERDQTPPLHDTGRSISIEREMVVMAEASSRHEAALAAWKTTLDMMRLAATRPE